LRTEIAVVVVHYGDPTVTLECLQALYACSGTAFDLYLVDNGASSESCALWEDFARERDAVHVLLNPENRGFAGACNQAIETVLESGGHYRAVALLNNDAIPTKGWLDCMQHCLDTNPGVDMVAARMMCQDPPDRIDSLGIVFYKSGIASNRKSPDEPLLGPCGGAALYSTRLLAELRRHCGEVFDERFFCYAEDTDLALRARALGFRCAMADDAIVHHWGSLSSGGRFNEFIAYHGLRNSLFALVKNLPAGFFMRHGGWILLMQLGVIGKYLIKGKPRLVWRIYRDFLADLPTMLAKRRCLQTATGGRQPAVPVSGKFYAPGYVLDTLHKLFRRDMLPPRN
jgi:GT2 family glycosyltransferase